jgi:hypothetical protein
MEIIMQKQNRIALAVASAAAVASSAANAALPAEVTAAFATQTANWTDMSPLIWGLLALTSGGFMLMKMYKKGANKAI